jgi:hypothetical protein
MLNMSIADIKEAAAGTITGAKPPTTWVAKKHPVNQWINADVDQREKIVNSPGVCGMGFFTSNNRFKIIQGVATWAEVDDSGKLDKTYVVGQLGNSTVNPHPSAIPIADLSRDCHQFQKKKTGNGEIVTWFKSGKNNIRDWAPKAGEPSLVLPVGESDWRIVCFPVGIPLVYGHTLISGALTNPEVKKQLLAYHPAMADWIHALSLQILTGKAMPSTRHIDAKYAPKPSRGIALSGKGFIVTAPTALSREEDNELEMYDLTINTISDLRRANEAIYYEAHPANHVIAMDLAPSPTKAGVVDITTGPGAQSIAENLATLMGVDPLMQGDKSHSGNTQKTTAEVDTQRNWQNAQTLLMLEGARIVTNHTTGNAEVAYPTITEDWAELYSNNHVAQLSPALSGLLEAACDDRDSSVHYLDKAIQMPEFSQLAAKSLTQVITKRSSLDDNTSFKRNEISILMLLRAPDHSNEYNNYCTAKYTTEIEHLVGQTEKQQTKVGTEIFIGGIQDHPDDVITAIANFDVLSDIKYGHGKHNEEDMPLLNKYVRQLGDLWCSRAFRTWYNKVKHGAPWITHTLLTQLHTLIAKTAMIANNPTNKRHYKDGKPLSPRLYLDVAETFERIKSDTLATISSSSLGSLFTSPPSSYRGAKEPIRSPGRKRDADHLSPSPRAEPRNQLPDLRGWLVNNTRLHINVQGLVFCSQFACEGSQCRNRHCDRPHKNFPLDFTPAERLIVTNHVRRTPGLMFANHVSLPSFVRGQGGSPAVPPPPPPVRPRPTPAAAPRAAANPVPPFV